MHQAFIALGSNLGKRQLALRTALRRLHEIPGTRLIASAPFLQTAPVDAPPGSPDFLNTAAHLETSLSPAELFSTCCVLKKRSAGGADASLPHNAPRTIDLDLLLFDDQAIALPNLIIPHPRMHLRHFVLAPLAQIAPDIVHPASGKTIRKLLADLDRSEPPAGASGGVGYDSSDTSGTTQ